MKKKQLNEQVTEDTYVSPSCEEVPVWIEGVLCDSNESVGETQGEW